MKKNIVNLPFIPLTGLLNVLLNLILDWLWKTAGGFLAARLFISHYSVEIVFFFFIIVSFGLSVLFLFIFSVGDSLLFFYFLVIHFILFFEFIFNWRIIALQCCICFCLICFFIARILVWIPYCCYYLIFKASPPQINVYCWIQVLFSCAAS